MPPDVDTPEGWEWLRSEILQFVSKHPGVTEDKILRHAEDSAGDDYAGTSPSVAGVNLLFEMVTKGVLRWAEQRRKPDAPLRYWRKDVS